MRKTTKPVEESLGKVDAILAGAMQEFLRHGYAATTMDKVTQAAGVSKATVYSYFQDKEGLFTALIEKLTRERLMAVFNPEDPQFFAQEPKIVLHQIASNILDDVGCSPELLSFIRLIIGESGRFPALAQIFVRNVHKTALDTIYDYFAAHPELQLPDPEVTARMFMGTLIHFRIIRDLLHGGDILPMERDRLVDNLVNLITSHQIDIHGEQLSGTRHKATRRKRTSGGKFKADYGDEKKKLRSVRLTDTAWAKLDEIAREKNLTRSEMIEIFARQGLGDS